MAAAGRKTCNTCGVAKPRAAFHRRAASSDGLQSRCKDCESARPRPKSANDLSFARARSRAFNELRRRHPEEFDDIFAAELASERGG